MNDFGSKGEFSHFALIGDIQGSRQLPDRAALQSRLLEEIASLNLELGDGPLASPLALTAGDELQGLLCDPAAAVDVLLRLAEALHPVTICYGLGYGALSTALGPNVALLDGSCFHRAREALDRARKQGRWLVARGFGDPEDEALSSLFGLMGTIRSGWTAKQTLYARESRHRLQKEVAERQGVSPSVVSESLKSAHFHEIQRGEQAARLLLRQFGAFAECERSSSLDTNSGPTKTIEED